MQELERTREKKKISVIIKTLNKLKGDGELLNRTMDLLSLVLASESCGLVHEEDNELLVYMDKLLATFKHIFIEFKDCELPVTATIALMKSCLYMKIVASVSGEKHLQAFQKAFVDAGIFGFVVELFEAEVKKPDGSKLLLTKMLTFVTFMIYDLPRLYFDNISGVRLESLIKYQASTPER